MPWTFPASRCHQREIMEQPGLDRRAHFQALRALSRINYWSASASILWPELCALAQELRPQPLLVLDVASGAGDVPLRLWHLARRAGMTMHFEGCDASPRAVEYAQQRAVERQADVHFFEADALRLAPTKTYDVLTCSLFLHHLSDDHAAELLRQMAERATHLLLVNDLVRSLQGLLLAQVGCRLLTRSALVHHDGPLSVRRAFTVEEVRELARRAGLEGAMVVRRWPCRFLLRWRRPQ